MTTPHPTEARFPRVPAGRGHYESFYLKASHPSEPIAAWIRYTVHKRPGSDPTGSLWFTLFDPSQGGPRAQKLTHPGPAADARDWIRVGEARIRDGEASGAVDGVSWELRFDSAEPPLFHLARDWMYRGGLPRTKVLSPVPAARFDGRLDVDGRRLAVTGWRGVVGHNWGSQHAERWIWLHGLSESGDWLDAAIGRVKLGPVTTPWVGSGAISLAGERHPLGGVGRRVEVSEAPDRCEFALPGSSLTVRGTVCAARKDVVAWVYADPDGPEHHALNCSVADMRLSVERRGARPVELVVSGAAAYELGVRERDHGVPVQPFPDG